MKTPLEYANFSTQLPILLAGFFFTLSFQRSVAVVYEHVVYVVVYNFRYRIYLFFQRTQYFMIMTFILSTLRSFTILSSAIFRLIFSFRRFDARSQSVAVADNVTAATQLFGVTRTSAYIRSYQSE